MGFFGNLGIFDYAESRKGASVPKVCAKTPKF